jgi:hypothetical protein
MLFKAPMKKTFTINYYVHDLASKATHNFEEIGKSENFEDILQLLECDECVDVHQDVVDRILKMADSL